MLVSVKVDSGFSRFDFDGKKLKPALRRVGNDVRKEARKLISRHAVSAPGDFPGKDSGEMQRSIKVTVARNGYWAAVAPSRTSKMDVYYPAFVVYGHRAPHTETDASRRVHRKKVGRKVALPRKNFIVTAAERHSGRFESEMTKALADAIKVGIL